jgi:hypothetical protein
MRGDHEDHANHDGLVVVRGGGAGRHDDDVAVTVMVVTTLPFWLVASLLTCFWLVSLCAQRVLRSAQAFLDSRGLSHRWL